jgi:hypothetical protein
MAWANAWSAQAADVLDAAEVVLPGHRVPLGGDELVGPTE